jgi:hypothetical protein
MRTNLRNQTIARTRRSIFRPRANQHDALLVNRLAVFNFRPPIMLVFPSELRSSGSEARESSW